MRMLAGAAACLIMAGVAVAAAPRLLPPLCRPEPARSWDMRPYQRRRMPFLLTEEPLFV